MDNVKQALAAMYSAASQDDKKRATLLLEEFQKTSEAWQVAHDLLLDPNEPLEYKMFASQTLKSKAIYDLVQLPQELMHQLKDSVLELLAAYSSDGDRLIRTQLCLTLAHIALQYLQWDNAMSEISAYLTSKPEYISSLLEFFRVLPEELCESNKSALTDEEFNTRSADLITHNVENVLLFLKNVIEQKSAPSTVVLDCLNSWIKECPVESICQVDLFVQLIFDSITHEATFEKAVDCLVSILRETRDISNFSLIDALYGQILKIHEFYSAHPDRLDDSEVVEGLTKLYVEAGELWHVLIAKNATHFKPLVQILLNCCKYDEDLDVVKYTFYFWYELKQMITLPKFEAARNDFQDIYLKLVEVIIKHLAYPVGENESDLFGGDKEQEDKFKDFRYEMGEVLKDCCAVVGAQKALNIPFHQLQTLMSQQNTPWQPLEACLFSMRVMAKEVSVREKTILPSIMQMLVQLPEHPKLRYAATLVLGRYSEWTQKNPEFLEPQLNYITRGFQGDLVNKLSPSDKEDVYSPTCHALMYFCQDCSEALVNYLEQLYVLYQQVQSELKPKALYDMMSGLAHVIKKIPPQEQVKTSEMFLGPTLNKIKHLATEGSPQDQNVTNALHDEAELVSIYLKVLRARDFDVPEYPIANYFMSAIWPVVETVLDKFSTSLHVSEGFVKVIKNAVLSCNIYISAILPQIAQTLHKAFRVTTFGCYLYVSGIMLREFSDESVSPQMQDAVYDLGLEQSSSFFELLQLHPNSIREMPDVIEDFFSMSTELLMFYPSRTISNENLMKSILHAGILTLTTCEEYNPLMACVHFFIDYVSWGSPYPPISFFDEDPKQIQQSVKNFLALSNHGEQLMKVVLHGLIFKFYNDVDANDLVIKILTVSPSTEQAIGWLQEAASSLANVSSKEIEKLIGSVSVALPNKDNRRVRVAVKDFVSWYSRKNVNLRSTF